MFHLKPIQSLDHSELQPYLTLKRPIDHQQKGIFVAEGEKPVVRLLESALPVVSLLVTERWLPIVEPLLYRRPEDIPVYLADKELVDTIVGFDLFQGVMAIGTIPKPPNLDEVLAAAPRPLLFAAADGISNSENMGVLVRNCVAFSVGALLVGETSCHPYLRRAVRNSMGTVFRLPIIEVKNLAAALRHLEGEGAQCIATDPHGNAQPLSDLDLAGDCCLVFGSEGYGISDEVAAACSRTAVIPMPQGVDSLNVSSAAAVILYEANRQRRKK
jgi:tRNA G18 (ribose-2'-O)-methylase SpoU